MDSFQRLLSTKIEGVDAPFITETFAGQDVLFTLYAYKVGLLSTNTTLTRADLIGHKMTVTLKQARNQPRYFQGEIEALFRGPINDRGERRYDVVMMPSMSSLLRNQNSRIFQNNTFSDITSLLLTESEKLEYSLNDIKQLLEPLIYSTQYNESDWHYICRLCEALGIYFYFRVDKDKETLCFVDEILSLPKTQEDIVHLDHDPSHPYLSEFNPIKGLNLETIIGQDFHPSKRDERIQSSAAVGAKSLSDTMASRGLTDFIFPGEFDNPSKAKRLLNLAANRSRWSNETYLLEGSYAFFQAGLRFDLQAHSENQHTGSYYLYAVKHEAYDYSYDAPEKSGSSKTPNQHYSNTAIAIPVSAPFKPKKTHRKPMINGIERAIVSGPKDQPIYTNALGQVKVTLPWDQAATRDEKSSCWLPLSQTKSGDNHGAQFIPRVGQSVLVAFHHGDPDRPYISGTIPYQDQAGAYDTPGDQAITGFRTKSLKSNDPTAYSAMHFDDKAGQELIHFKAQKDSQLDAINDLNKNLSGNETVNVSHDQLVQVLNQASHFGATEIVMKVGMSQLVVNGDGIQINALNTQFKTKGAGGEKGLARVGDAHHCIGSPLNTDKIVKGSPNIKVNNHPAARKDDPASCGPVKHHIAKGASSFLLNTKHGARVGDKFKDNGAVSKGSKNATLSERGQVNFKPADSISETTEDNKLKTLQRYYPSFTYDLDALPEVMLFKLNTDPILITVSSKPAGSLKFISEHSVIMGGVNIQQLRKRAQMEFVSGMGSFKVNKLGESSLTVDNDFLKQSWEGHYQHGKKNEIVLTMSKKHVSLKRDGWKIEGDLLMDFVIKFQPHAENKKNDYASQYIAWLNVHNAQTNQLINNGMLNIAVELEKEWLEAKFYFQKHIYVHLPTFKEEYLVPEEFEKVVSNPSSTVSQTMAVTASYNPFDNLIDDAK
jgi:type VI secretion system secreted protein VgrG